MSTTHIVIVNYNAGPWLSRSLASALAHSDGRVTVVDNDSCDDSVDQAKQKFNELPRLNWIENDDNRGFAAANNQVLDDIESDYAVIMNPDCEINAQTLPLILEAFETRPNMGMASCRILNQDGTLQATCRRRFPTPWSSLVRIMHLHKLFPNSKRFANFDYGDDVDPSSEIQMVDAISGAFMVVRRSAIECVGGFDKAYFMHCEDLDWCKRFEVEGLQIGFIPKATVLHAKGVSSASRPIKVLWNLHSGMNRFFDTYYNSPSNWPLAILVKIGIMLSFLIRALASLVRGWLRSWSQS